MISLTLYRMIVSVTVLFTVWVITDLFLDAGIQREEPAFMVATLGSTAVMIAWSTAMTVQRKKRVKPDGRALPWWAVVGITVLSTGLLAVLLTTILG